MPSPGLQVKATLSLQVAQGEGKSLDCYSLFPIALRICRSGIAPRKPQTRDCPPTRVTACGAARAPLTMRNRHHMVPAWARFPLNP